MDKYLIAFGGKTQRLSAWAHEFGFSQQTLYRRVRDMGVAAAFELSEAGKKIKGGIYIYSGPEAKLSSGYTVKTGEGHTMAQWGILTGIDRRTLDGRLQRWGQDAFSLVITTPLISGGGRVPNMPNPGGSGKKAEAQPPVEEKKRRRTTMDILRCRAENPRNRCTPCLFREGCYGT